MSCTEPQKTVSIVNWADPTRLQSSQTSAEGEAEGIDRGRCEAEETWVLEGPTVRKVSVTGNSMSVHLPPGFPLRFRSQVAYRKGTRRRGDCRDGGSLLRLRSTRGARRRSGATASRQVALRSDNGSCPSLQQVPKTCHHADSSLTRGR